MVESSAPNSQLIDAIEDRLQHGQWIGGTSPSREDADLYSSLRENPPHAIDYPRSHAWYTLVHRFSDEVRSTWTTETSHIQVQAQAPVAKAVAKAAPAEPKGKKAPAA